MPKSSSFDHQNLFPKGKTILFAVLHWGLGHASRSIPLIKAALENDNKIILASDGLALELLKKEIPQADHIVLPSYDIKYSYQSMIWSMVSQSKKFYATYRKEKVLIASLVETHGVDIIVSDNRFGCNHPKVHNIYITHQLNIVPPLEIVGFIANSIHHFFIGKYDEVWVPDTADHAYSGTLSQVRMQKNLKYIGPLSRLKLKLDKIKDIDIAIILSGPEPQRTILEQLLLSEIDKIEKTMVLIRGSKDLTSTHPKHISIINVADQAQMEDTLSRSRIIICRSGYSSIMDLLHLQAEIIFIPTPGQTEQEYLAEFHSTRYKNVHSMKQNEIKSKLIKLIDSLG